MIRPISPEFYEERNKEMVRAIDARVTASSLGIKFNLSRERVCQIYYKLTGKSVRQIRKEQALADFAIRVANRPKCKVCGTTVSGRKRIFCSPECRAKHVGQRREKSTLICFWCKQPYHPYSTAKYQIYKTHEHRFCTQKHYLLWVNQQTETKQKRDDAICKFIVDGGTVKTARIKFQCSDPVVRTALVKKGISLKMLQEEKMREFLKNI